MFTQLNKGYKTMKKLFGVRNNKNKLIDRPETCDPWFDNKMEAKEFRDSLTENPPYTICYGPDHYKYIK